MHRRPCTDCGGPTDYRPGRPSWRGSEPRAERVASCIATCQLDGVRATGILHLRELPTVPHHVVALGGHRRIHIPAASHHSAAHNGVPYNLGAQSDIGAIHDSWGRGGVWRHSDVHLAAASTIWEKARLWRVRLVALVAPHPHGQWRAVPTDLVVREPFPPNISW